MIRTGLRAGALALALMALTFGLWFLAERPRPHRTERYTGGSRRARRPDRLGMGRKRTVF